MEGEPRAGSETTCAEGLLYSSELNVLIHTTASALDHAQEALGRRMMNNEQIETVADVLESIQVNQNALAAAIEELAL